MGLREQAEEARAAAEAALDAADEDPAAGDLTSGILTSGILPHRTRPGGADDAGNAQDDAPRS